jgi:hypothetical protein
LTLRIERVSAQGGAIVRLIGRVQSEHLAELKTQIEGPEPYLALDLEEVTLVDIGVVRFLLVCQESGMELLHCSPYIRQWMVTEKAREGRG